MIHDYSKRVSKLESNLLKQKRKIKEMVEKDEDNITANVGLNMQQEQSDENFLLCNTVDQISFTDTRFFKSKVLELILNNRYLKNFIVSFFKKA